MTIKQKAAIKYWKIGSKRDLDFAEKLFTETFMKQALLKSKKFIDEVKKAGIPVSKAYLFGSRAKGKAHRDSDIDAAVVSSRFGKDYFGEMGLLRDIALEVDDNIEPHPFNYKDLNDRYSTLAAEIRKYGILMS